MQAIEGKKRAIYESHIVANSARFYEVGRGRFSSKIGGILAGVGMSDNTPDTVCRHGTKGRVAGTHFRRFESSSAEIQFDE